MTSFIKVVEIWTPTLDKRGLCLADALYGDYDELRILSENCVFAYDEGLPGKTWSMASPQILTDLEHSYFRRKEAAIRAGLKVGIGIPILSGEFLIAVIVLLCGEGPQLAGAVELWAKNADKAADLGLVDGYYGSLKKLESVSRSIRFSKGNGLPGTVWDYGIPMVTDMSDSALFKRASTASIEGITSAFALPFVNYMGKECILTFLSAHNTPIARRFDIWLPDREHKYLFLHARKCETGEQDALTDKQRRIPRGDGLIGQVWSTGMPAISTDPIGDGLVQEGSQSGLATGLVMPIITEGFLKSLVVFML
jgi:hypothetical protein